MSSTMGQLQKPGVQVRDCGSPGSTLPFARGTWNILSFHHIKWPLLSRAVRIKLWQITQLLVCSFMRNGVHNSKISVVVPLLWETGPLFSSPPGAISAPHLDSPFLNLSSWGTAPALSTLGAPSLNVHQLVHVLYWGSPKTRHCIYSAE